LVTIFLLGCTFDVLSAQPQTGQGEVGDRAARSSQIEEVVVTARRREESVQDVPMSVSALTGDDLRRRSVRSIEETFDFTPNVTYEYSGYNTSSRVYVRGIGNAGAHFLTGDPSVALYLDGVYQGRASTGIFDLIDVERVEVLRGPQGTLFGRNSTGGAIQVITRSPTDESSLLAEVGAGNDDYYSARLIGNFPLTDRLYARAAIGWREREGYQENLVNGDDWNNLDEIQARAALRFEPTDTVTLDLVGHYTEKDQRAPLLRCEWDPLPTATGPALLSAFGLLEEVISACTDAQNAPKDSGYSNLGGTAYADFGGVTFTANWETTLGTLTSISSWQQVVDDRDTEADGSAFPYFDVFGQPNGQDQYSQELRFAGSGADGALDYVVGLYGFYEKAEEDAENCLLLTGSPVLPPSLTIAAVIDGCSVRLRDQTTESAAAFGEATYHLTDKWEISAGIRRTVESKEFEQQVTNVFSGTVVQDEEDDETFHAWTPRFNISYHASSDLMFYGGWSEGYKSGGFNGASPLLSYSPETVEMWEVGFKSGWLDNQLVVNAAAFYGDYEDMQLLVTRATTQGEFLVALTNAAESTVQGVEMSLEARASERFSLGGTFGYTDAEYDDFFNVDPATGDVVDLSNNKFPSTPKYNYSLFLDYSLPVGDLGWLGLRADWVWQSKTWLEIDNIAGLAQEDRELLNLNATFELMNGRTEVSLWAKNLLDKRYTAWVQTTESSLGYHVRFFGPPRWYGIQVTHRLGNG
jgi:iron complex outermembrane receptor protein